MATKLMSIRRSDTCVRCEHSLPPSTRAWWDSIERTVTCTGCRPATVRVPTAATADPAPPPAPTPAATPLPPPSRLPPPTPIDHGTGGISAQREYDRRVAKRRRLQEADPARPVIGGIDATLLGEPITTTAWAKGADGERRLAAQLDRDLVGELDQAIVVLHDRKVPGTRWNLDHLVVAPSGVWVIDAKNYAGLVERRDERLFVKGRNQTKLVDAMGWQQVIVGEALAAIGFGAAPIHSCLCFTNAEWKLLARPFTINGVWVGYPTALTRAVRSGTGLHPAAIATVAHHLSTRFPASI